jgi:hypothetical protein
VRGRALASTFGGVVVTLALLPEASAAADADRFALAWVRAAGAEVCPSSPELARLVEATVGIPLTTSTQATVLVDGLVAPKPGGGFRVLIRATTADGQPVGERRLESDDARCSDVTRSTLLVLAVMINPDAASLGLPEGVREALEQRDEQADAATSVAVSAGPNAQNPQPELPARERPPAREREPTSRAPQSETSKRRAMSHSVELSADLVLNAGLTPSPTFGAALTFGSPLGDVWLARLEAAYFPGGSAPIDSPYAVDDATISVVELSPELCWSTPGTSLRVTPCAGLAAGVRMVDGKALQVPAKPTQPYLGALAAVDVAWFFSRHAFVDARLHAAWMPKDDRFVYTDHDGSVGVLFDPAPFAGYAALGAGGAF